MMTILQACECEKCEGYGQESGATAQMECLVELRATLKATQAELERWRHGIQVEGDYVCPDSLALIGLRSELERAKNTFHPVLCMIPECRAQGVFCPAHSPPRPPRAPGCTCQPAPRDSSHQPACARYGCTCPYVLADGIHYYECKLSEHAPLYSCAKCGGPGTDEAGDMCLACVGGE